MLLVLFFDLKVFSFNFIMLVFFSRQTGGINESFLTPPRSTARETPLRVTTDISLLFLQHFLLLLLMWFIFLVFCFVYIKGLYPWGFWLLIFVCVCAFPVLFLFLLGIYNESELLITKLQK